MLKPGFPGLDLHNERLEKLIKSNLPRLSEHFQRIDVSVNLFSTEWVMSIFLSFIPIELTNMYLDAFFQSGWEVFYRVSIEVLRFFQESLLQSVDPGEVIGQIKQAKRGCEHLLGIQLQSTESSLKTSKLRMKQLNNLRDTNQSNYRTNINQGHWGSDSRIKLINTSTNKQKVANHLDDNSLHPENFKETTVEEARPEGPQSTVIKKKSNYDVTAGAAQTPSAKKRVAIDLMSDEILDDVSSDLDENFSGANHKMWLTILQRVRELEMNLQ